MSALTALARKLLRWSRWWLFVAAVVCVQLSGCACLPGCADLDPADPSPMETQMSGWVRGLRPQPKHNEPFAVTNRGMQIEKNLGY